LQQLPALICNKYLFLEMLGWIYFLNFPAKDRGIGSVVNTVIWFDIVLSFAFVAIFHFFIQTYKTINYGI
jgi:hypothetical protein